MYRLVRHRDHNTLSPAHPFLLASIKMEFPVLTDRGLRELMIKALHPLSSNCIQYFPIAIMVYAMIIQTLGIKTGLN